MSEDDAEHFLAETTQTTNPLAIVSLVAAVLGVFFLALCCCSPLIPSLAFLVLGTVAAITGRIARKQIAESDGKQSGENLALIGLIAGCVEAGVSLVMILLFVLSMAGMLSLGYLDEMLHPQSLQRP